MLFTRMLCNPCCNKTDDDEILEHPRVISAPRDGRWLGGMRPFRAASAAESERRRRDLERGITVQEEIHVEVVGPTASPQAYVLPAVDRSLRYGEQEPHAIGESSCGKQPSEALLTSPFAQYSPADRDMIAPWAETEDTPERPLSSVSQRTTSVSYRAPTRERLRKRQPESVNLSRFSWASSSGGDADVEMPELTRKTEVPAQPSMPPPEPPMPSEQTDDSSARPRPTSMYRTASPLLPEPSIESLVKVGESASSPAVTQDGSHHSTVFATPEGSPKKTVPSVPDQSSSSDVSPKTSPRADGQVQQKAKEE